MPTTERFDVLVIGSGEAGKYLAWTLSKDGHRTALVERKMVGGSCPNVACLPSKNAIHAAKVASYAARAASFGLTLNGAETDMPAVQRRNQQMVEDLVGVHLSRYDESGAELVMGEARFVAPKTITVANNQGGTRALSGERVMLSVGTRAAVPSVPGLADARPMTHVEALELDRVPGHLIVVGGGYVGLELAQAFRRFGARVTVIERGDQLAGREDVDVSAAILDLFRDEGIHVLLGAELRRVEGQSGNHVRLEVATPQPQVVDGTDVLIAAGRTPNTDSLGLEAAGVELDARGYVVVNDRLETSAPGVWAVGDCAGSPQFTHVAFDDFRVLRDALNGGTKTPRDRLVPYCMFTDPRAGAGGTERIGGEGARHCVPTGDDADVSRAADTNAVGAARVHEDADRSRQRSHPGLQRLRGRSQRADGGRTNGDARPSPVHRSTRCPLHPSNGCRRTDGTARGCTLIGLRIRRCNQSARTLESCSINVTNRRQRERA